MHFEVVYLPGFPVMKSAVESIGKISFINMVSRELSYKSATQGTLNAYDKAGYIKLQHNI